MGNWNEPLAGSWNKMKERKEAEEMSEMFKFKVWPLDTLIWHLSVSISKKF